MCVVLERKNDPFGGLELNSPKLLDELSERAHCSMLFVIKLEKISNYDAELKLMDKSGKEFKDSGIYISNNTFGCMETRANGSITSDNIALVILPKNMEPYKNQLNVPQAKLMFVPSHERQVSYNIGSQTKGIVTLLCPNYELALQNLEGKEIFTHMLRSSTNQELG